MKRWVQAFVRRVDAEGLPVEAIIAYRADQEAAIHRWAPGAPRNIYSHTKSFLSLAVGLAVEDGALSLADRPAAFFPESIPADADERIQAITLRDLLRMASGFDEALLMSPARSQGVGAGDYVRYLFSHPVKQPPGVQFRYSNGDSYLAGRMVEARVGCTLQAYLQRRLFAPMGIEAPRWEHDAQGHTFAASGLLLSIEDMAKLGRLCLKGGVWNGEALVSAAWLSEATAAQIAVPGEPDNPWEFAYGYQFWRSPYPDAYRAHGAYGQVTMVLPHADAVVSIQCTESERFPEIQAALHEELLVRL